MKQMTREELIEGMADAYAATPHGLSIRESMPAVLAYIESVSTVVRQDSRAEHEQWLYTTNIGTMDCKHFLLLPYDPRPKQASAKKRAAELLRDVFGGRTVNRREALALAAELDKEADRV